MAQDKKLNERLKRMWSIQERIDNKIGLLQEEKEFYNAHLKEIREYYLFNFIKWSEQTKPLNL